jgi:hypothetical protein
MMRGEPTTITGKADQGALLEAVKEEFRKMYAEKQARVISEQ